MEVLVEHDYVAKEPNELSITKGDIIKDVIKKQGGWWEGTLKDKKGLFPDNFVRIVDKDPSVVLRSKKDVSRIRQCRVVFSYKQDHEDELNLNVGDIIDILGEEEEGWWRGLLNGKQGVFPSNFVEEIIVDSKGKGGSRENLTESSRNDLHAHSIHSKPTKILCEVKFPYKAQNDDELTLKEGELVTLISKDGQDPGWWKGELNGVVGVFPDNFVSVVPASDDKHATKEDKRPKPHAEPLTPIKPSTVSAQRKSLESHNNEKEQPDVTSNKTPPIPGKKPSIPIKKSPSGSSSSGGLFYGLKKKLVDVVDGATGSKNISPSKTEQGNETMTENVFDDVVRRPLLADVRATRPKAPGRRLPTAIFKESESGVMNGNTEDVSTESIPTTPTTTTPPITSSISSTEVDAADSKPKLREWEKHKAPWLDEMKLNQAKRTSTSPGPDVKPKLTPPEKNNTEVEETKPSRLYEKEASPIEMSKSMSALSRLKTPPNEAPVIRNKPLVPIPTRPQTIQNISNMTESHVQKTTISLLPKTSPLNNKTPSPLQKIEKNSDSAGIDNADGISKHHLELVQRISKLEEQLKQQAIKHENAIEELKGKLQIETEMRMELQAKFENFVAESAIQQI